MALENAQRQTLQARLASLALRDLKHDEVKKILLESDLEPVRLRDDFARRCGKILEALERVEPASPPTA